MHLSLILLLPFTRQCNIRFFPTPRFCSFRTFLFKDKLFLQASIQSIVFDSFMTSVSGTSLPSVNSPLFIGLVSAALVSPYLFICGIYAYHFNARNSFPKLRKESDQPIEAHIYDWKTALFKIEGISGVVIYMGLGLLLSLVFPDLAFLVPESIKTLDLNFKPFVCLLLFFVFDSIMWCVHYTQHNWRWLYYNTHAFHHTISSPTMIVALTGYLPDTCILILFPLHATLFIVPNANFVTVFVFAVCSLFHLHCIHSEFQHPWDNFFRTIGIANSWDHHVHHLRPNRNLAHFFVVIDKIMGTYIDPLSLDKITVH